MSSIGLRGHAADTLDNVGQEVGLTRENVRQVQIAALRSLRNIIEIEGLNGSDLLDSEI